MKQHVTVNKPWVNRQPQAIILPASSPVRRSLPLPSDVTVVLRVASCSDFCGACGALADVDACFCGMCGNQL